MLWLVLALQFLIRLRFPSSSSFSITIIRRYGQETMRCVRRWENVLKRYEKAKLDVAFLEKCLFYKVFPKFVHFKLYNTRLHRQDFYGEWQKFLVEKELIWKRKQVANLYTQLLSASDVVKQSVFWVDFNHILHVLHRSVDVYKKDVSIKQALKLHNLGAFFKPPVLDSDAVITNLSSKSFSNREKWLLSFGLDHCFSQKFNSFQFKLCNEVLLNRLTSHSLTPNEHFSNVITSVSDLAASLERKVKDLFMSRTTFSFFTKSDFEILRKLKENKNLIFCKPDKGRGIVVLDKSDYIEKMQTILNDRTIFSLKENIDPLKNSLLLEDKLNRMLKTLKDNESISTVEYNHLYCTGSNPGILYGLPKTHKEFIPMRPVLSAINTFNYKLAKFMLGYIEIFAVGEYTLLNSTEFVNAIKNLEVKNDYYMVSYDITSLYTNVPLDEVLNITTDLMYANGNDFRGINKKDFLKLLKLSVCDCYFMFDGNYYLQHDGLAMGNPLSATLANIFLVYYEKVWLNECPKEFKPVFFKRYMDDTFAVFKYKDQALKFFDYINSRHHKISFTMEAEIEGKLPFLDVFIEADNSNHVNYSVFRKPTFSGQCINYISECYVNFKSNAMLTLFHRAFNLSDTYHTLHKELCLLINLFRRNGFPDKIMFAKLKQFLNSKFVVKPVVEGPQPLRFYFRIPFINDEINRWLEREYANLFKLYFPQIYPIVVFFNSHKLRNYLNHKERLSKGFASMVVYQFSCNHCQQRYVGSTKKCLEIRHFEHAAVSYRTKRPLTKPLMSSIREHCESVCNVSFNLDEFVILSKCRNETELRIAESMHIRKDKPSLNKDLSSFNLKL